ncbi:MAG: chemotaxis protein CheW [Gammaproteobacteria bacterium]
MSTSVFQYLVQMEQRTSENAAPLPAGEEREPDWRGLGFQLGGARFVAPLGDASEILTLPRVTKLPGVREWVWGVANIRGRLVPVIDLQRVLGTTPATPRAEWRILVVEDGDLSVALVVELSLGMQQFPVETRKSDVPREMDSVLPFVRGSFRHGGRIWYVFSLKSLVRYRGFLEVADSAA